MRVLKVLTLIIISHFLARNKIITKFMDTSFEKVMCSFVLIPFVKFITSQKGWKSSFSWERY
ncbi:hypothetical protein [Commensalibacter intestini]|uniref:hypothetical protein n=1 Tax=Commensalibacter intestini TaxID=479936 RepID=UPI00058E9EE0|nr:hypothetical protein [Commensalibacter intestini]